MFNVLCAERNVDKQKCAVESIKIEHLKSDVTKNQTWMTDEVLVMMEERKTVKRNSNEYRNINREIRNKIKKAKAREMHEMQMY